MKKLCTPAIIQPIVLMASCLVCSFALLPAISFFAPAPPPEFVRMPPPPSQDESLTLLFGLPATLVAGQEPGRITLRLGNMKTPPLPVVQQVISVRHEFRNVRNLSEKHLVLEARFRVVAGLSFAHGPLCVQVGDWAQEGREPQFSCSGLNEHAAILSCELEGRPNLMLAPGVMNGFTGDDIVEAYAALRRKARAAAQLRVLPEVGRCFPAYLLQAHRSGNTNLIQL